MAASLTRFSWWLWGCKEKETDPYGSSLNSSSEWSGPGLREPDSVKFLAKGLSSSNKVTRKWHSRDDRSIDKQCGDVILVASDGGVCLSGSESDGPDWSIGWVEAHGPDFGSGKEPDDGFAVLVPCYKSGCSKLVEGSSNQLLSAMKNLPNEFTSEGKNRMEWLSSLQNF